MKNRIILVHFKNLLIVMGAFVAFLILVTFLLLGKPKAQSNEKTDVKAESKENKEKPKEENKKIGISNQVFDTKIKLYLTKEDKIVEMNLEDYIVGVVSAEMPASFSESALEAQAIAARTYTLAHLESTGGHKCAQGKGADLCDEVHCQAYINKEKRFKAWDQDKVDEYWKKVNDAVHNTEGKVLTYDDALIKAFYFSTSSGKTENCQEVFKENLPYLKSVESKGEEVAPKYETEASFTDIDMGNKLKSANSEFYVSDISKEIKILSRTEGGSVKEIKIGNTTFAGTEIRKLFGLSSANFDIDFTKGLVNFKCKGYGHGVGMSQWGANIMGKEGKSSEEILKHYYSGSSITGVKYK